MFVWNPVLAALLKIFRQLPKNNPSTSAFFEKLLFSGKKSFFSSKSFYGHVVTKFDNPADTFTEEVEQLSNNIRKW